MSFSPPTSTSNVYGGTFSVAGSVTSLPAYTAHTHRPRTANAAREPTQHVFEIKDKKDKAWATLNLSSSARSTSSLPVVLEGEPITGSVSLDISNGDKNILGITVRVRGSVLTGPSEIERRLFLDVTTPLWLKGVSTPGNTSSKKLSGDSNWPFSISLPTEVVLPDPDPKARNGAVRTYKLPQTFSERTTRVSVIYELYVHIARSMFRVDDKLQTMFVYVPALRPEPPSPLRQMAYRQNGPVPGPDMDPNGWQQLSAVSISGKIFNNRRLTMSAVLSLAKPLSYTRGSVIPLSIAFSCGDTQALNLVCTPTTINVVLQRSTSFSPPRAGAEFPRGEIPHIPNGSRVIDINRAVWWPVAVEDAAHNRRFDGELHLPKTLKPSSSVPHFNLSYRIVLFPCLPVTGFVSDSSKATAPLLLQEVEIATIFPRGPKVRFVTAPTYEFEIGDNLAIPPARSYI
ncbi:hypothetical protein HMN09_00403600 [Mycena chlorophos]|uniref:Arrestin-like N-terminal domain-containing protein n=1 Tax=Mycena chlorophos TaxID=658473 RepID=A0A8H6TJ71_MYCCL|nr:hypothetical protein HMN09_00403600 [Mycena chlorophos]